MLLFVVVPALALGGAARAGAGDLLDILQPGSRPAVGLVGDPFLSPLDDACGFWAEVRFTPRWSTRLDAAVSAPVRLRSAEGSARLGRSTAQWTTATGGTVAGRALLAATRVAGPSWEGSWQGSPGPVLIGGAGTQVVLGARLEDLAPGLSLQAIAPVAYPGGRNAATGGVGARYRLCPRLAAQAGWSRGWVPERFDSDLYGEPISASINLRHDRFAVDARATPWRRLWVEYSGSRTLIDEIAPRDTARAYEVNPSGSSTGEQIALGWGDPGAPRLLVRWTRSDLELRGIASWGGLRFGQLNILEGQLESWLAGIAIPRGAKMRFLLDAERASLEAHGRGEVESWPFASGLVLLLGQRMIGRGEASARWTRWHAGLEQALGSSVRLETGIAWYDVRPRASLTTWRPVFLVFGQTDVQYRELGVRRLELAAASFGLSAGRGSVTGGVRLRQFVFARALRSAGTSTASGAAPPSAAGAPPRPRGWPGGTLVELSLTKSY